MEKKKKKKIKKALHKRKRVASLECTVEESELAELETVHI